MKHVIATCMLLHYSLFSFRDHCVSVCVCVCVCVVIVVSARL